MLSLQGLVSVMIYLLVAGLVFWLLNYLVDNIPLAEPFHKIAKIVLMVLAVLVVIGILLSLVGGAPVFRP